jgi:glucosyl-dolichyl phosphate glucuronosyltransferase
MTSPRISVIIATYSRASLLDECLRQLAAQHFCPGDDVIVVDNASVDDTTEVVRAHQATFPTALHLLHEPQPGKSHALARALSFAEGEVLAFLDDDVNVAADWLNVVRQVMEDPTVALMGGRVVPRWEPSVPTWMRYAPVRHPRLGAPLGLLDYPADVVELGPRTALGANMAARRRVFDVVGGFATHLGKLRGTLLSGEDHELCVRVQRAGLKAIYAPRAVVHHWVPAERARTGYFLHWFYWSGITNAILDAAAATGEGHPANRYRSLLGLPLYLITRALLASMNGLKALAAGKRTTALNHASDVAYAAGYAAHVWGLSSGQPMRARPATPEAA